MINKKVLAAICGGLVVAGGIISWLLYGGDVVTNVELGNDIKGKINASLKDSVVQREKDGIKLWEFKVGELVNDKFTDTASLKQITGKLYRQDGTYLNISAASGSMDIKSNNFTLEGNVSADISDGSGYLRADMITWEHEDGKILAQGNVKLHKDQWYAEADEALTTSEFKDLQLRGNALVERGDEHEN